MTNDHWSRICCNNRLPAWFERPTPQLGVQPTLFPEDIHDVLARLKVSPDELGRWHQLEWMSFDATSAERLEPAQFDELVFVRDVVRSGLSDAVLRILFEQLPRPLAADPDRITYSFTHGWVQPVLTSEPDPGELVDANVDAWFEQLAEEGQMGRLIELRARIEQLLVSAGDSDSEESIP